MLSLYLHIFLFKAYLSFCYLSSRLCNTKYQLISVKTFFISFPEQRWSYHFRNEMVSRTFLHWYLLENHLLESFLLKQPFSELRRWKTTINSCIKRFLSEISRETKGDHGILNEYDNDFHVSLVIAPKNRNRKNKGPLWKQHQYSSLTVNSVNYFQSYKIIWLHVIFQIWILFIHCL